MWKLLAGKKMAANFIEKLGFLEPKNSKDEKIGEIKLFEKLESEKLFKNWN